jgi:hypothetical protein
MGWGFGKEQETALRCRSTPIVAQCERLLLLLLLLPHNSAAEIHNKNSDNDDNKLVRWVGDSGRNKQTAAAAATMQQRSERSLQREEQRALRCRSTPISHCPTVLPSFKCKNTSHSFGKAWVYVSN